MLCAACGTKDRSEIVEFCIPLEESPNDLAVARVVLDYDRFSASNRPTSADTARFLVATESPMTVVDLSLLNVATGDASAVVTQPEVKLGIADALSDPVAVRAAFWGIRAIGIHMPPLGPAGSEQTFAGLLGGNLLRRYAVRLFLGDDREGCMLPWRDEAPTWASLTFSPEYADTIDELSKDGYGVIKFDLAGGGQAEMEDEQFEFYPTRVAVGACVEPQPFDPTDPAITRIDDIPVTGVDAFLLIATGTQPLVLSETFYQRLVATKQAEPGSTWTANPSATSLYLPEGETYAQRDRLTRMVLIGNRSNRRGPCAELQQRRWIEWAERCRVNPDCNAVFSQEDKSRSLERKGSAVLELDVTRGATTTAPELPAYVVSDNTVLFWGLRAEMGTTTPVVDALVGTAFLRHFEVVLDYPNSRLIMRCASYKEHVAQLECDPSMDENDRRTWKSCCLPVGRLGTASCCDTRSLLNDSTGHRVARSCYCAGSPCCQYFRYEPEKK